MSIEIAPEFIRRYLNLFIPINLDKKKLVKFLILKGKIKITLPFLTKEKICGF